MSRSRGMPARLLTSAATCSPNSRGMPIRSLVTKTKTVPAEFSDCLPQDRLALRRGEGDGRFVAAFQVAARGRDVAGPVVAVAGDENGQVRPLYLGEQLVLDEWLTGQVQHAGAAEFEAT